MLESDRTIRMELKYCERCGSLYFRVKDSDQSFCDPCVGIEPEIAGRHRDAARARKLASDSSIPALRSAIRARETGDWYGPMTNIFAGAEEAMNAKEAACVY